MSNVVSMAEFKVRQAEGLRDLLLKMHDELLDNMEYVNRNMCWEDLGESLEHLDNNNEDEDHGSRSE